MLFAIAVIFFIGGFIAVTSNSDTFSPAKFFLAFYLVFHVGAVFDPPSSETLVLASVPLLMAVVMIVFEATRVQFMASPADLVMAPKPDDGQLTVPFVLWAFSVPSLVAQIVMINNFGGVEGYIQSINTRVVDWSGFGWARVLIGMLPAVNVAFFAIGLSRKRSGVWWALFALHLAMVVSFGLLSGSRSGALNIIALLVVTLHYLRRPVRMAAATGFMIALMGFASLLGVARNGFKLQNGELTTGFQTSTESFSFNSFNYGIDPLAIITGTYNMPLAHGSTFLSLLTNSIPRSLFPDKPDTGGVFFTKYYVGNEWEGFSNLTPTFLGEWIINFGYLVGIIGFVLSLALIMAGLERTYSRLLRNPRRSRDELFAIDLVIYIHVLWSAVALIVGEVTNVVLGLALNSMLPLVLIRMWMVSRSRKTAPVARMPARLVR